MILKASSKQDHLLIFILSDISLSVSSLDDSLEDPFCDSARLIEARRVP